MALHLAYVITELGQGVGLCRETQSGPNGFVDLRRPPAGKLAAAVEQHFHKSQDARVLDFNSGDFAAAALDRQGQSLEQREIGRHIEQVGLGARQAIRNRDQFLPRRVQILQPLFRPRSLSRLTRTSRRRKVANFSYIRASRPLQ